MTAKKSLSIKGIAIILMLIHHLFTWGQADYISISNIVLPNNLTIEGFFGVFGKLCVTLYLFLSGYGFSSKYFKKTNYLLSVHERLVTAWKVYRKYALVLMIFLPYGFIDEIYSYDIKSILINLTGFNTSYNKECWFLLVYILIVIFVLPELVKIQNNNQEKWAMISSLGIIVAGYSLRFVIVHSPIAWFRDTRLFFNLYYFMLSQFAFVLGWMCKRWHFFERLEQINIRWPIWIVSMAIIMVVKVYCPGGMFLDTILTPFFVALCLKALKYTNFIDCGFMALGKHSTYMWMTHTFFAFYYASAFIYGFKYPIFIIVALVAVSFATSCVLNWIENLLVGMGKKLYEQCC